MRKNAGFLAKICLFPINLSLFLAAISGKRSHFRFLQDPPVVFDGMLFYNGVVLRKRKNPEDNGLLESMPPNHSRRKNMKKTFAVMMAAVTVMSTALTAFADVTTDTVVDVNSEYTQEHIPGDKIELLLGDDLEASELKISNKLSSGKDAIESVTLGETDEGEDTLIIQLKKTYGTKKAEIEGDIQLRKKTTSALVKTVAFDFDVQWPEAELDKDAVELEIELDNAAPVYDFSKNNKGAVFTFSDLDASYAVRLEDQPTVNLYYSIGAVKSIVQANEDAELSFLHFAGEPEFDFNGTLSFNVTDMDKDWYLYEINSKGGLVKTKAAYDEEEGVVTLKTRKLTSYVLSDKALKASEASTGSDSEDKEDSKNPATGSVDFVNVAVALGVVSLAAAGAVAMKKAK